MFSGGAYRGSAALPRKPANESKRWALELRAAHYLDDPDFVKNPLDRLLDKNHVVGALSLGGKPVGKNRFYGANDPRRNSGLALGY